MLFVAFLISLISAPRPRILVNVLSSGLHFHIYVCLFMFFYDSFVHVFVLLIPAPGPHLFNNVICPLLPERNHIFYCYWFSPAPGAKGCTTLVLLSGAWNTRVVHPFLLAHKRMGDTRETEERQERHKRNCGEAENEQRRRRGDTKETQKKQRISREKQRRSKGDTRETGEAEET